MELISLVGILKYKIFHINCIIEFAVVIIVEIHFRNGSIK